MSLGSSSNARSSLHVEMSWWAMMGLGEHGQEWSDEEKFKQIADAGFNGINGYMPAPQEQEELVRRLDQYGLSFSITANVRSVVQLERLLQDAADFGRIDYVNVHVPGPYIEGEAAAQLISDMIACGHKSGIPVYIETHRGMVTQDLLRTVQLVERLPELRLTVDFSHYVVAGELTMIPEESERMLQQLLPHTSSIHARVSNGEQIQVDVGPDGEHPMLEHYIRWWGTGMKHWRQNHAEGSSFPFVCELGPSSYAMTTSGDRDPQVEISDRWSQSLYFMRLARLIWFSLDAETPQEHVIDVTFFL